MTASFSGLFVVLLASFALPHVTGYGTMVFEAVALSSHSIVANLTSLHYAETHRAVAWCVAGVLNGIAYALLALVLRLILRRFEYAAWASSILACVAYLLLLFLLFPGSDGP